MTLNSLKHKVSLVNWSIDLWEGSFVSGSEVRDSGVVSIGDKDKNGILLP